jgi:Uma2 family endonuclease
MTVAEMSRTYTPEDLLRMPDNGSMELVNGRIVAKQVSRKSSKVEALFTAHFQVYIDAHPGVADVFPQSLGYQCFNDDPLKIRRPDTTVVRLDRLEKLGDDDSGFMPIVPDLAVEVISPNDVNYDVLDKVQEYLDAGFPLVWLADPKARTITVYPRGIPPVLYSADDDLTAEEVLPGFRCKVGDFFPAPAPRAKK